MSKKKFTFEGWLKSLLKSKIEYMKGQREVEPFSEIEIEHLEIIIKGLKKVLDGDN